MPRVPPRRSISVSPATATILDAWAAALETNGSALVEYVLDDDAPQPISFEAFHAWDDARRDRIRAAVGRAHWRGEVRR